jgi:hypothetical protein
MLYMRLIGLLNMERAQHILGYEPRIISRSFP